MNVMHSTESLDMEALKTKNGNESLPGICRKLLAVTKSGVAGGSGPEERDDGGEEPFMGCLKDCCGLRDN